MWHVKRKSLIKNLSEKNLFAEIILTLCSAQLFIRDFLKLKIFFCVSRVQSQDNQINVKRIAEAM